MRKKELCLILSMLLFAAGTACAATPEKQLETNWNEVLAAYTAAPAAEDTLSRIDSFVERWKDSNRYEASRAKYLKAMTIYKDKKYQAAYNEFKDLTEKFYSSPYTDSAMYIMAECLYNMGRYNDAIEAYNQYRFKFTDSMYAMEAVYGIALSYLNLKEFKKADRDLSAFLERNSFYADDEKIKLIGGVIDYYLERYDSAVNKLSKIKSDVAYYYLGHSYVKTNKFLEGATAFKRISDGYPQSKYLESAMYNKAEAFYKGENYDVAAGDYKAFVDKFPGSKLAQFAMLKRGSSLMKAKKYDLAALEWGKTVAAGGDKRVTAYAQYLIGEANRMQKKYQAALSAYLKAISDYPDVYDVVSSSQVKAGWCYMVLGDSVKAESVLTDFTQKFVTHDDQPLGFYLL
ncbi:MAG TPA: tetratricopeptide repeat protein, partial [Candidatus Goldiibacteriota bacterium]|nr:tetratricopeptide repeat protein [Candidatus Goldiibacteriota bacterium]